MGGEFGHWIEWNFDQSLDWHLLEYSTHAGMQNWVRDLNHAMVKYPALHEFDCRSAGFEWIDCQDSEQSVLSYLRKGKDPKEAVLVVVNFTPIPRHDYRIGVPEAGYWREILNSDSTVYGGSGLGNYGGLWTDPYEHHARPQSVSLTVPPLAMLVFKHTDHLSSENEESAT